MEILTNSIASAAKELGYTHEWTPTQLQLKRGLELTISISSRSSLKMDIKTGNPDINMPK